MSLLQQTMKIMESFTKEDFFFSLVKVMTNSLHLIVNLRSQCRVDVFLQDVMEFCEDHCDSRKIISRLTANFNTLSKVSSEIINLLYESDPENVMEDFKVINKVGGKIGEFTRIALGFSTD